MEENRELHLHAYANVLVAISRGTWAIKYNGHKTIVAIITLNSVHLCCICDTIIIIYSLKDVTFSSMPPTCKVASK